MTVLATIGYEGAVLADFIATLKAAQVSLVLDIREAPISRRPGFSKRVLAAALEEAGLAYVHLHGLGNPKPGRDAAKSGDKDTYLRVFTQHMTSDAAQADLVQAAGYTNEGGACLLCYERDHRRCHRDIVADALVGRIGVTLRHLKVEPGRADAPAGLDL